MAATQILGDSTSKKAKELATTAKAVEREAKRKTQFEKDANDLRKQPGSLVLSNKSPSQLPNRQTAQSTIDAPIDIYADPNDWRGKQGVKNPPPVGNIGKQTYTYVPNTLARNPYDYASGRGTTEDYEKYEDAKKRSGFTTVYDPTTFNSKIAKGTKTNLNSPETQRMLDVAGGFDVGTTDQMKREIAKAQQTGEPVAAQTPGRSPGDFIQVKNMIPKAEFVVPKWHQQVIKNHPTIGKKGSKENNVYVQEYKRKTALGESFDPIKLADDVVKGLETPGINPKLDYGGGGTGKTTTSTLPTPTPTTPVSVPATPDPVPAPQTSVPTIPPPIPPPATSTPAPVAPITYEPSTSATPTPATPASTPAPATPAPTSAPAPIIPTNSLPDSVTPAEDAPTSLDPNRPTYGGKTNTLPPGALNPNPLNRPDFNPTPVNPYAPVYNELNGNVNPGQYSPYRPVDPSNTIDLNAAENFNLQSYDTNLTGKRDATPSLPQANSRGRFAPNGAVEPDLPVASTNGNNNNSNLMPPEMDVYTPVEKKKKRI